MPDKLGDEANPGLLKLGTHAAPIRSAGVSSAFGGGATTAVKVRQRRLDQVTSRATSTPAPRPPPRKLDQFD